MNFSLNNNKSDFLHNKKISSNFSFSIHNNSFEKSYNSPSFKSIPLYKINLKKMTQEGSYEKTAAFFCKLDPDSSKDILAIKELRDKESMRADYFGVMTSAFLNERNRTNSLFSYYTIQLKSLGDKLSDQITCLMQVLEPASPNRPMMLEFIEKKPSLNKGHNAQIKGSGELSLFGLSKIAKKKNFDKLMLCSTNDEFYRHVGFKEFEDETLFYDFGLEKSDFAEFAKKVSKKYEMRYVDKEKTPKLAQPQAIKKTSIFANNN